MDLAISAWVSEPAIRTARSTLSRFARCSEDCDPGVSIDMIHPPRAREPDRSRPCRALAAELVVAGRAVTLRCRILNRAFIFNF
ncbi:hypothetical protein GCM10009663_47920 [Kitasatospora arboriphila]|uniref:Uncharacterized protein n=1 Tax=Kitasatospora arboriphila TaxID=258052 RepID=A0ABN1TRR7_9ACTN